MKRNKIAAIATAAPLALMLTAGTALATSTAVPAEPGAPAQDQYVDLACTTLLGPDSSPEEYQAQAQAVLAEDPNDPSGLDADGDGVACELDETLTGELAFEDGSGYVLPNGVIVDVQDAGVVPGGAYPAPSPGEDLACVTVLGPEAGAEDLQREAQAIYDADPADPNDLDADGNGLACEFSQEANGEVAFEDGSGYVEDSASPAAAGRQDLDCVGLTEEANPEQEASPSRVREQAQAIHDADPTDPNGLDANRNGAACEFEESSTGEVAFEDGSGFAEVVDSAAPPVAPPVAPEPSAEVAPVSPPSGADGPVFQPAEPDVVTAPQDKAPRKPSSPAPTHRAGSVLTELPTTGGAPVLPISGGAGTAGTALVGTALLALAARRRPPGV